MGETQLRLMVQPQEFFRERVTEAVANQRLEIGGELEFYVVNLLCEFVAPGKIETVTGELNALETPLAIMLKEAVEAPPMQRLKIFKYLGDTSLYFAGFFQDYFTRKTFDIGYYISLGSTAYNSVSTIMRDQHQDEHFTAIYNDLSEKFKELVDVVAEVSEIGAERPLDLLSVYDRWSRSNSDRLLKVLNKAGIIPIKTPLRDKQ